MKSMTASGGNLIDFILNRKGASCPVGEALTTRSAGYFVRAEVI